MYIKEVKIKNKVDYSLICSLVKVFGNRFVSNNPPWCRLGELKRPTLYNSSVKMAEGELNVDSLISRLLEGEQFELYLLCVLWGTGEGFGV